MAYAPALPHDPIQEIFPDVFLVRGQARLNALLRLSRNMVIVRHGDELSLVNPVRLDAAGEARLRELGQVKRLLRLGPMHGIDDPYYVGELGAELWAPGSSEAHPEPKPDVVFDEDTPPPVPDARFFVYQGLKQKEAVLLLPREGGVLLSCDGIQHYGDYRHNNLPARLLMPFIGFPKTTVIGPFWLKLMVPDGHDIEPEFRRLLAELEFEHLVSAHGSLLRGGAHASVEDAVDRAFAK